MDFLRNDFLQTEGGVTAPRGFMASGIPAGIKKDGSADIALVFSQQRASAAGIFTLNKVRGHSLEYCENNLRDGFAGCVFINSGNANACLGPTGYENAVTISKELAALLDISHEDVLTGSTGVIGHPLPMEKIIPGLGRAVAALSPEGGSDAARAIMTTDTYQKETALRFDLGGHEAIIGGMAKGSGMIHPNMATMIGIITTDANIPSALLKRMLKDAADKSFNRISVDGDTSVCDKILILANGMSGIPEILPGSAEEKIFSEALTDICVHLSKQIAADGEGATKLIEINIKNAMTENDAHLAAKAIANSPLVKTAFYGEDANWGRILTAAGYSGADFNPSLTSISIGPLLLYDKGVAIKFDEGEALAVLKKRKIFVEVDFGSGSCDTTVWTCDLSNAYVDINAKYRT